MKSKKAEEVSSSISTKNYLTIKGNFLCRKNGRIFKNFLFCFGFFLMFVCTRVLVQCAVIWNVLVIFALPKKNSRNTENTKISMIKEEHAMWFKHVLLICDSNGKNCISSSSTWHLALILNQYHTILAMHLQFSGNEQVWAN